MPKHTPIYTARRGATVYSRNASATAHRGRTVYPRNTSLASPARRKRPGHLLHWVTLMALLGLLVVGIQNASSALTGSNFFRLAHVKVVGTHLLPEDDVVTASGLVLGSNLFACDLASVTDRLAQQPMIEQALLIREPPETLVISLVERQPVALVSQAGELMGLDSKGGTFPLPPVELDLPVVTGMARDDSTGSSSRLAAFLTALKNQSPDFWRELSEVHITGAQTATVYLVGDGLPLRMTLRNPEQQVRNFRAYTAATPGANADLAYVDLRFQDQVVVGRR